MAELSDLSTTDASNIARFPEGQAPSTVNNGARALEGLLARAFKDSVETNITSTGSANAYVVAANRTLSAYYAGLRIAFITNFANTGAATVNVDALGAKNIYKRTTAGIAALASGDIQSGDVVDLIYDGTQFQLLSAIPPKVDITGLTQETALLGTDSAIVYDASESANNEAVLADIVALGSLGLTLVNGTLTAAVATNALTIAIKTLAGTDPSATDPVTVLFRNVTAATGDFAKIRLTAATSVVVSSGSTLGATSATAFKVWIVGFNDGGTFRLGVINCRSGVNIYPLGQFPIASSTAEGGAGAADSAHVFYTGTAVTSKAYSVLGYASWETGLTTAGTWDAVPTRLQLYGLGVPLPGNAIQTAVDSDGAVATGTTVTPWDDTIPQNTEGDEYLSRAITPTSAANILDIEAMGNWASSAGAATNFTIALHQDTTADALAAMAHLMTNGNNAERLSLAHRLLAGTTSATTFKIRVGAAAAATTTFNGAGGARKFGGVSASSLRVTEIMT